MAQIHFLRVGCALICLSCGAAAGPEDRALLFSVENDVFTGTDSHYTSGVRAEYVGREFEVPAFTAPFREALTPFVGDEASWRPIVGAENLIMTPPDITVSNPPPDERPYAGWLRGHVGLAAETERRLDVFRVEVGLLGPASGSEFAQKRLHEVIGSPRPLGWKTQIGTTPTLALGWGRTEKRAWQAEALGSALRVEALPHLRLVAGNVDTFAAVGATVRTGQDFGADFGPAPARIGASGGLGGAAPDGFGWSTFVGGEVRAIAHAGLLEGPLFGEERSAEPHRLVADVYIGGSLRHGGVSLTYAHTIRTGEYRAQPRTRQAGSHQFGALSVGIAF